jgi:putative phage-type endonuclease
MSLSEEQLAERHTGIGGSDAAPALALSPYKTPLALFLEKRERPEPSASTLAAFRWGHLLEPVIRQEYATMTGRVVRLPEGTLRHPKHSFMLAHVDGVTDDQRIFEAKTARTADGWGRSGSDEVPHHYLIQVQHYLAVTGLEVADIAVLIGGNDFRVYEVPADLDLQEMIVDGEREFWKLVETNTAPPPEWDIDSVPIMQRLFSGSDGSTVIANAEDTLYQQTFVSASERAKSYEAVAENCKAHLLHRLGNGARLVFAESEMQLTRKQVARKAYSVGPSTYIDSRFSRLKETG